MNDAAAEAFIGLMSGTSLDAMDGVLADMAQSPPRILATASLPLAAATRQKLLQLNVKPSCMLADLAVLEKEVSTLAARVVQELVRQSSLTADQIQAIGYPGQTIAHQPDEHWTLQCGDPNILAEQTRIRVVADFRRRDLAAGGQGAPLASSFHQVVFADTKEDRIIINLGGIVNITKLFVDLPVSGFDIGPANCLLDDWAQKHLAKPYDDQGQWARSGQTIDDLLYSFFMRDLYFSRSAPKTCGRDYFNLVWLEKHLEAAGQQFKPEDVQSTLVELTALNIAVVVGERSELRGGLGLYVAGGGVKNSYLMERIKSLVKCKTTTVDELGVPARWLEALCFAWLARCALREQPGNVPTVTGAVGERVLGAVYHR